MRLDNLVASETVEIFIDGSSFQAPATDSVALATMRAGLQSIRINPATGTERAPYCMMGVCFECLMTIDGVASRQACMVRVRPGMRIERQLGARDL